MPLIWCSISSHGFGHAAQAIPVLNALATRVPGLRVILRTMVPVGFFEGKLTPPWQLSPADQDIGCVQRGPLFIDYPATLARHLDFQQQWQKRIDEEVLAMQQEHPALVLSNVSWLAVEAASRLRIPAIALSSLSWDQVLEPYVSPDNRDHHALLAAIRTAYAKADIMLRLAPGLSMPAFPTVIDVGPVVQEVPAPISLPDVLQTPREDVHVLIAFGGISLDDFPFERLEQMTGYQLLISGTVPTGLLRCHAISSLPLPFGRLFASADIIMSKPGYSTVVEAVAQKRPLLYVRRYNFADEDTIVGYLHRYGHGRELAMDDFAKGFWLAALDGVRHVPAPQEPAPAPIGAVQAATILASYF
jgi:hypothetical protein